MKKRRVLILVGVLVVVLAAGAVYLTTQQKAAAQSGLSQLLATAQKVKVVQTNLMTTVASSGSVIPAEKVQLSFGTSGTVTDVKVTSGSQVKQGDVLATLDTTDLQYAVTQAQEAYQIQQLTYSNTVQPDPRAVTSAQVNYDTALAGYKSAQLSYSELANQTTVQCAQLTTAQNALDLAQTAYDRLANDHQAKNYLNADWGPYQNVVTNLTNAQSAYDLAAANCNVAKTGLNDSALRSAEAQVQSAKASLDNLVTPLADKQIEAAAQLEQSRLALVQAQQNLANATIVAPFDGVVTAVNITPGDTSVSDAIDLADMSHLHVDVLVDETQIAGVSAGQKTQLTLDAMPGITLTGQVTGIDPAGIVSQGVVNYNVHVSLNPVTAPVRIDMTANASIIMAEHDNVLAVPNAAIQTGFGGNRQGGQFGGANGGNFQAGQGVSNTQRSANVRSGQTVSNTQGAQSAPRIRGPFVFVLRNGQPTQVQVTEGLVTSDMTEVSGDLQAGDVVLIPTITRSATTGGGGGFRGGFGGGFPGGGRPFGD